MNYKLLHNEPMSLHTTFRTGGRAKDYYIIDNAEGLIQVFDICRNQGVKPLVIGNGSNLLISDMGLDVPVIEIGSGLCDISVEGNIIKAEAGAMLSKVAKTALQNGLAGMEFASEMIIKASKNDLKMLEFPTNYRKDGRGHKGHLRTFRDGFRHLVLIIKLK